MIYIDIFTDNTQFYVYKYTHYIYLHAHIAIDISIKVNIIHIFSYEYSLTHHIFHVIFVYIHTFFHYKMMCNCRLATCLYDIQQTSYERRLHHGYVMPPVPIWATFYTHPRQDMPIADSSRHACPEPRRAAAIIYRHILLGEKFAWYNPHTRTWENPARFFSLRSIICTVYCWEKCKKL